MAKKVTKSKTTRVKPQEDEDVLDTIPPDAEEASPFAEASASAPSDVDEAIGKASELKIQIADLKRQLGVLEEDKKIAEAIILGYLQSSEIDSIKKGKTVFYRIRDMTIASINGTDATVEACIKSKDLQFLLGINHPKLKSYVKEQMTNDVTGDWEVVPKKLPKALQKMLKVEEFYKLGHRG